MNRFNVYGFHIFKFHFNLNSFIMVFTNHFSFIYYNSQANINTLIKTADYMMRSKSISRGAEKTASLVIRFCLSVRDAVFSDIFLLSSKESRQHRYLFEPLLQLFKCLNILLITIIQYT